MKKFVYPYRITNIQNTISEHYKKLHFYPNEKKSDIVVLLDLTATISTQSSTLTLLCSHLNPWEI